MHLSHEKGFRSVHLKLVHETNLIERIISDRSNSQLRQSCHFMVAAYQHMSDNVAIAELTGPFS